LLDANEGDAASQSQREKGEGEKLAHGMTPKECRISAAIAFASVDRGRLSTDDGEATKQAQRKKGEGEKFAHGRNPVEGDFQQLPLLQSARAGVDCSALTKATPPVRANERRARATNVCMSELR
jgi:hypothetical protein